MKRRVLFQGVACFLALIPVVSLAQSEGCTFKPAIKCAEGSCTADPSFPVTWMGMVWINSKETLRFCVGSKCVDAAPTIRRSLDGDYIATTIFQNPKQIGGLPKKLFGTYTNSPLSSIESRAILWPMVEDRTAATYLSSGNCQGAG